MEIYVTVKSFSTISLEQCNFLKVLARVVAFHEGELENFWNIIRHFKEGHHFSGSLKFDRQRLCSNQFSQLSQGNLFAYCHRTCRWSQQCLFCHHIKMGLLLLFYAPNISAVITNENGPNQMQLIRKEGNKMFFVSKFLLQGGSAE